MKILFSDHAADRMALRGITKDIIKEAIQRGAKHLQKPDKIVSDYRYFSVIYTVQEETIRIITVQLR